MAFRSSWISSQVNTEKFEMGHGEVLKPDISGFFFHGRQKTQGQKNSSHEKTQAVFQPETQGTGGFFQNLGKKLNFDIIFEQNFIRK